MRDVVTKSLSNGMSHPIQRRATLVGILSDLHRGADAGVGEPEKYARAGMGVGV